MPLSTISTRRTLIALIIPLFFICFFYCCHSPARKVPPSADSTSAEVTHLDTLPLPSPPSSPHYSSLEEVVADSVPSYWGTYGDSPTAVLHFNGDAHTLSLEYSGDCRAAYPFRIRGRQLIVFWADRSDCKYDPGLTLRFSHAHSPVRGTPFLTLELRRDTLFARYVYPQWVRAYNAAKGTVFPDYFPGHEMELGD